MEDRVRLAITDWNHRARGVGRLPDGRVVFVGGALPGEEVTARIVRAEERLLHAEMIECHRASPERRTAPCPLFGICGGCDALHRAYPGVLSWKRDRVVSALRRLGGIAEGSYDLEPIAAPDPPWRTRNKAEYACAGGAVGFRRSMSHAVVDVPDCLLLPPEAAAMAAALRRAGSGELRGMTARINRAGEAWAELHGEGHAAAADALLASGARGVALDGRLLAGPPMTETLGDLAFELTPGSFWQVSHHGLDVLIRTVLRYAGLTGGERVLDAYCGVGAFSLPLARRARSVLGIERFAPAADGARHNAGRNAIGNAAFIAGDVERVLPARGEDFEVAVVDPPRRGCHRKALAALARIPLIVYVSCDPATLARDVRALGEAGFVLRAIQPVDMFPWTAHVETVALLARGRAV